MAGSSILTAMVEEAKVKARLVLVASVARTWDITVTWKRGPFIDVTLIKASQQRLELRHEHRRDESVE